MPYRSCRIPRSWPPLERRFKSNTLMLPSHVKSHKRGPRRVRNPGGRFQIDFPESPIILPILDLVQTHRRARALQAKVLQGWLKLEE